MNKLAMHGWRAVLFAVAAAIMSGAGMMSGAAAAQPVINNALLPSARSVAVGEPATFFISVVNSGDVTATQCRIVPSLFNRRSRVEVTYRKDGRRSDLDRPFRVPAGETVSFLLSVTPSEEVVDELGFEIQCDGARSSSAPGVNTVQLTALADGPVIDILAVAATPTGDGHLQIQRAGRNGVMSIAALRVPGDDPSTALIRVRPDSPFLEDLAEILICEIDASGACLTPRAPFVDISWAPAETRFFAVFARGPSNAGLAFRPDYLRLEMTMQDEEGYQRAATSVAISSPAPEAVEAELTGLYLGRNIDDETTVDERGAHNFVLYRDAEGRHYGYFRRSVAIPDEYVFFATGQANEGEVDPQRWRGDALLLTPNSFDAEQDARLTFEPGLSLRARLSIPLRVDNRFDALFVPGAATAGRQLADFAGEFDLFGGRYPLTADRGAPNSRLSLTNGVLSGQIPRIVDGYHSGFCSVSAAAELSGTAPVIELSNISIQSACLAGGAGAYRGFILLTEGAASDAHLLIFPEDLSGVERGFAAGGYAYRLRRRVETSD